MQPFSFTRRELLLGLAGTALASARVRNSMYDPQIAAHTSVWLAEAELRNIGPADILDEAFTGTRNAGYTRVELVAELLDSGLRARTLALMARRGIAPSILYTTGPLYDTAAAEISRKRITGLAWLLMGQGTQFVNLGLEPRPGSTFRTAGELDQECYQLNRLGEDLQHEGIGLMVHHTQQDMRDDAREWRYRVSHTEPGLVSFCLDLDWIVRAGLRPLPLIDTAGPKLRALHLRNPKNGIDQELLRDGDIDMLGIARFLRRMSYDGFLVVDLLHNKETPRQYPLATELSLSRWYMQEVFGERPGNPPVDMGPHVREKT